ncbi:hypothetical protein MOVS_03225 [Moraxella ovis]|uniref:Uncharacterized protein n=1 Tax=Moraxella ovis TaxID=29433 RepID=A0ABN4PNW9_9GAMM|nr:hypothetical protein MOVS_03225 [Moraxella ovis]
MALYDSNEWQFIKLWIILHHTLHILKKFKDFTVFKNHQTKNPKTHQPALPRKCVLIGFWAYQLDLL